MSAMHVFDAPIFAQADRRISRLLALSLAVFVTGCTSPADSVYNPMPEIWGATVSQILVLEKSRASELEWISAAETSEPIVNETQLGEVLRQASLDANQQGEYLKLFATRDKAIHFGFEGNYHALVFFKNGLPAEVLKW